MKNNNLIIITLAIAFTTTIADYRFKIFLGEEVINVQPPSEINGDENFSPLTINRGESSIFTWNYDYIKNLTLSGNGGFVTSDFSGSHSLSPIRTSNYYLEVDNGNATINKDFTLRVIQPDPIITFNADKLQIGEGQSVNLSWNVQNSDSASINHGIGSINLNDSLEIFPTDDTIYTLNAIGYFGEKTLSRSLTIDVVKNSIINSFTVNKNNFTVGESATFNWNVTDSEGLELEPFGVVSNTSQNILLNSVGSFDYTLKSTNFNNTTQSSSPITVNVYGEPIINSYTVNSLKTINVEAGDDLNFAWNQTNGSIIRLDNNVVTGSATTLKAPSSTKTYNLVVENGAGKTVQDSVSVNVVQPVAINTFTNPSNVFANAPFTMNWTGSNVEKYELNSTSGSGINGTEDLAKTTSKVVTPTSAGTYTYTLKATNLAEKSTEQSRNITVEADPTFTGFTVNGGTSVTVAPSASLSFVGTGYSSGATLQGRNSANTADAVLPANASTSAGSTTYYANASKTVNGVERFSTIRSVVVNVVETWVDTTPTYTSWVNSGAVYGCTNWTPDPSTVNTGETFTQTATDCKQDQTRTRQDRERETTTGAIRNKGVVATETNTLTASSTRSATGTKVTAPDCRFVKYTSNDSYIRVKDRNVDELILYWNGEILYDGKENDFKYSSIAQIYYYDEKNPLYKSRSLELEDFEVCKKP